ncbi:MAG: hypothetical protein CMQ34_06405 [Gammaproteobacteria bacterium]|nr:hypothetical protein [Gammaproteobacteria bacterium]
MRNIIPLSILPLCLLAAAAQADVCKDINFNLDSEDIRTLDIDVGAGYLGIIGNDDDTAAIEVQGRACADSRSALDEMDIVYERRGDTWYLETRNGEQSFSLFSLFNLVYSSGIDVDIMVPAGLLLNIDDGSGDIDIRDLRGELNIDDGSGDIRIRDITGPVRIDDGSGDIELRNVESRVEIEDGSGDIFIDRVGGDVIIEDDGSGDIDVRDVRGDFIARDTGSGDVDFRDIGGRTDVRD